MPSPIRGKAAAQGTGLTEEQTGLLARAVAGGPAGSVLRTHEVATAGQLSALDFVKHHRAEWGIWRLKATEAGRQALAEGSPGQQESNADG